MKFDHPKFFTCYRSSFEPLGRHQVDGLEFLLGEIEQDPRWASIPQAAYFLATVQHETARTFQPIKEFRAKAGTAGRKNQDRYWLTGYYGRGYVQLTWKKNYELFDIADEPEKALEPATAYEIAARGMVEGLFTGRKLGEFVNITKRDYRNARRVINGLDRADDIADLADRFEHCLKGAEVTKAGKAVVVPAAETAVVVPAPVAVIPMPPAEVKIATTSAATKAISFTAIGTAAIGLIKELWSSSQQVTISAGQYLMAHLPVVLLVLGMAALGIWVWNRSQERAAARTKQIVDITADPSRRDVVIT